VVESVLELPNWLIHSKSSVAASALETTIKLAASRLRINRTEKMRARRCERFDSELGSFMACIVFLSLVLSNKWLEKTVSTEKLPRRQPGSVKHLEAHEKMIGASAAANKSGSVLTFYSFR
jgi:hypothetical protein